MNSVRGNIRQRRHRNELPNPPNRAEISVLPQLYQMTSIGAQFPRYDSEIKDNGQILKFTSDQSLELLSDSEHWLCNCTSKVRPEIFYHVYLIYALVNGRVLPCLFAILPNKNQQAYQIFFREVSNLVTGIPQDILFDFEQAAMNTMQLLLPNANEQAAMNTMHCYLM